MTIFDPQKFMARLRAGFSLNAVFTGKHTPDGKRVRGVGSRVGFLDQCRKSPEWGREAMALIEKNNAAARKRCGSLWRYDETCRRGHPFSGDNLGTHSSGRKYCIACNKLARTRGAEMTPDKLAGVRNAVLAGKTIGEFTKGPGFVCTFATLKRYRIAHPEFDRFILEHSPNLYSQGGIIRAGLVKENVGLFFRKPPAIIRVAKSDPAPVDIPPYVYQDGDHDWVSSLVSRSIPQHKREDVIQNAFEALLLRKVSRAGLPAMIKKLITAENRLHPTLAFGGINTPFSLDAAIFDDGSGTLGDRISRGLWD